jgi:uncharacterized membrane protein
VVVTLAFAALAWLALLVAAPILPAGVAAALYAIGSQVCHQRPDRSFHVAGAQLPVCARCIGIYSGAAIGAMAAIAARARGILAHMPSRLLLIAGAVPTAATVAAEWSGAWGGSNAARAAAGMPLGCVAALVVAQGVATLHYDGCARRRPIESRRPPTLI